jgi:hypothetical protein
VLSTAETLLGLSRHLSAYTLGPDRAALAQLEFAGQVLELCVRLRGSGVSTGPRVAAIALDAGISSRLLNREILPTLDSLGWVESFRGDDGKLISVSEHLPPMSALLAQAERILNLATPEPLERAVIAVLDASTVMPITRDTALAVGCEHASEEITARALDVLKALHLVNIVIAADGAKVVFNPNVWAVDVDYSAAALRAEDSSVRAHLTGLLEEVGASPGLPQGAVTSTSIEWINYAVSQGLIQRSLVTTSDDREQAFLFTPHMARSAFEHETGADPSGHVRQLIGSMIYAKNFASYKLRDPGVFLSKLIEYGQAGDASSIGSDYPMLETAGIVRVERADRYYRLVLLQPDVAEQAVSYLGTAATAHSDSARGLRDQRKYVHPERERAQVEVARSSDTTPDETRRILAALRQEAGRRGYGRR